MSNDMHYTPLQERIFQFVQSGEGHGIIDACAGSGKTTTIIACAEYVKDRSKTLFCAFNRSIRIEIEGKFHQKGFDDITVKTMHALGFDILKSQLFGDKKVKIDKNKLLSFAKSYSFIQEHRKELTLLHNFTERKRIGDDFWEKMDPRNAVFDADDPYSTKDQTRFFFYRLPEAMREVIERIVDVNMKYRLTLCEPDKASFEDMLDHFGFLDKEKDEDELCTSPDVAAYLRMVGYNDTPPTTRDQALDAYYEINSHLVSVDFELARFGVIDFVDMLYLPSSSSWDLKPNRLFDFIFVDECQDLSKAQLEIAIKYCSPGGRILAVGDPQQSIYGFAGADCQSFERIRTNLNATELQLSDCFRCPQRVIEKAIPYKPAIVGFKQYPGVVERIQGQDKVAILVKPGNMILSRVRSNLIDMLFILLDNGRNCYINHDNVEEIIEDLKGLFTKDELNSRYSPERLERNIQKIMHRQERKVRAKYFNYSYLNESQKTDLIEKELEQIKSRVSFIFHRFSVWNCSTITDVLVCLIRKISDKTNDAVVMSTVHRAKGLENDVVYLLAADSLPKRWDKMKVWEMIQEDNIAYVAYTRAKEELYLVADSQNPGEEKYEFKIRGSIYTDPDRNCHD